MFKRRTTRNLLQNVREALWPTMGWRRAFQYFWHRLTRLTASPHAIALGAALGVFAAFTPFMGLHLLLALGLAYLFGGNLVSAALATATGNPITFPLIWMAGYSVGDVLLGAFGVFGQDVSGMVGDAERALPFLATITAGSLPLGILSAVICYFPLRIMVAGFQATRRQRFLKAGHSGAASP